jgi:hypothetical protein
MNADFELPSDGVLTVSSGKLVSAGLTGDATITAWDVEIQGSTWSSKVLSIHGSKDDQSILLGTNGPSSDMHLSSTELSTLSATSGAHIGFAGSMNINGVSATHSAGLQGVVSLIASKSLTGLTFMAAPSNFHALNIQAEKPIALDGDITSATGVILLDADYDNDNDSDGTRDLALENGVTVAAKSLLIMAVTNGKIELKGTATLQAGTGVTLLDDLEGTGSGALVIDADSADTATGDGEFTLASGKYLSSDNAPVTITAFDVTLDGAITTGSTANSKLAVHNSHPGQTIGVPHLPHNLHN